ncbi:eukaryotic translation initiation factor 2A [Eucyclogobius newberryi]|uniref:eukaryotic translation initiation factor 2A n=1 Tax=Eucyclogobius newberryi TaxID=166745 RepID=UPI003B5BE6AB
MAPPVPLLAVRGSLGTSLFSGPKCEPHEAFQTDSVPGRSVSFSRDGALFAWCNAKGVHVVKSSDGSKVVNLDLPKTVLLQISPLNSIVATWQPYAKSAESAQGDANLQLWDLKTGTLLKALFQKKMELWCPSWSEDEVVAVRSVNNELHFYENNDFNTIANKLHMQKVSNYALSPGPQPSKIAVYVPGSKGAPSFVRLYQYPVLGGPTAALANKSFFKADKVDMQWNRKASAVLVTASTDVDKTGASYYGEQTLHFLGVNGETSHVQLPKGGPIYDVSWSPTCSEFCVVYGFMPAKATVYNLNCDAVFDFGTGPRNAAYYSPQGHILVLAGFGNLRGQMEVWDVKKYKQVCKPQAPDSTHFAWSPDGEHVVTATCSPRLRVSNGFKVWHYSGAVLHQWDAQEAELWEVRWQNAPYGQYPERPITTQTTPTALGSTQAPPTQAYRPPALRHLPPTASSKLHEDELPQNMKPGSTEKSLSKTALKNQRKREAKKAAKQDAKPSETESEPSIVSQSEPSIVSQSEPSIVSQSEPSSGDPETDKKIKNLRKKLKAIDELKEQHASGKVLQKNQVEKLQKESELLKELEQLTLA